MLLVRKIHVVKINSSEWLAGIAHPSCLGQGAHTARCLGSTACDSQVTSCYLHFSRFGGTAVAPLCTHGAQPCFPSLHI